MEQIPAHERNQQEQLVKELLAPRPVVIGLEGGPCGGKTTLAQQLRQDAAESGDIVEILPEAATAHLDELQSTGGSLVELAMHDRQKFLEFEISVMRTIVEQIQAAKSRHAGTQAIILADRCDIAAYVTPEEHAYILSNVGLKAPPILVMVDKLYYLPSVAQEDPSLYEQLQSTNASRYESAEEAALTCTNNLRAVARHPELHVAWGGSFEKKISTLSKSILDHTSEYEVKLQPMTSDTAHAMIRMAQKDERLLGKNSIMQSYHDSEEGEIRLRRVTTTLGEVACYLTQKHGEGTRRTEIQRIISQDEYDVLKQLPQKGQQLHKYRYELLQPSRKGEMQQWSLDYYDQASIQRWQAEVSVHEHADLDTWVFNAFELGGLSTRQLAMR